MAVKGAYLPRCGGESDFDGLAEQRDGQTSEIAREGINPPSRTFPLTCEFQ
jgi:hypothetical protein